MNFNTFFQNLQEDFTWEPQLMNRVCSEFDKQAGTQYRKHMNEWEAKVDLTGGETKGFRLRRWNGFKAYWQMEETKATSAINSHN